MSLSFGLGTALQQSQKLTPQMQQAIKLLQLSSVELEQEIQAKLDSNPLLERVEDEEFVSADTPTLDDWTSDAWQDSHHATDDLTEPSEDSLDKIDGQCYDDDAMDVSWQEVYDDTSDYLGEQGEYNHTQSVGALSIQDYVRWQINFKRLSALDKLIAEQLIDAMDEQGFIRVDLADVVKNFSTMLSFYEMTETVGIEEVQAVLHMIQSCDPMGVGACDLVDCLNLQLDKLPQETAYLSEARLLLSHAHYLQENQIKTLVDKTGLEVEQIRQAMALIRTLDPNPAQRFILEHGMATIEQETPDILVLGRSANKRRPKSQEVDGWQVLLNPEILPKLKVNQVYANLIKRGDETPDNQYLKHHLADARLFIRSIEERNHNLLKVATCIVHKQQQFLLSGATAMQPLTLREVAEEIGLHESTVSRLTTNKTMLTPQGMYPLKYFFSSHVSGDDGEVSSTAISAMIREMIEQEPPNKPLSDSELTKRLAEKGINAARRTVAKYREAMGIGSSTQRRQKL